MIRSFRLKGVAKFFHEGSRGGIQPQHGPKLRRQLAQLDAAAGPQDMNVRGWRLHALRGDSRRHWAIWVGENWRLTFRFEGEDAIVVDYRDYRGG